VTRASTRYRRGRPGTAERLARTHWARGPRLLERRRSCRSEPVFEWAIFVALIAFLDSVKGDPDDRPMSDATLLANFVDLRRDRDDKLLDLIHAEGGLYQRSFLQEDEREDVETHRQALWGDGPNGRDDSPKLHFIVATSPGRPHDVLGFAVAEYYAASRCGLLSYIAVEEDHRRRSPGRGIGRMLVAEALAALREDAQSAGVSLEAMFAEIHDPAKAGPEGDSMTPLNRLRVMDALDARRVPIPYVQPALDERLGRARTLMLIAFPIDGTPVEQLGSGVVRAFLRDLYSALDVPRMARDVDLARALDGLQGDTVALTELVLDERPAFVDPHEPDKGRHGGIHEYGIAIHLLLRHPEQVASRRWKRRPHEPRGTVSSQDREDDPLRSFEEDILAYADSASPELAGTPAPFRTHARTVPDEWALVSVAFPEEVVFRTEGRLVPLRTEGLDEPQVNGWKPVRTRRFLLRAARTDFRRGNVSVLHLVFGPDPGDPGASALNEFDVIKLMKLWQPGEGLERDGKDATPGAEGPNHFVTFCAGSGENAIEDYGEVALKRLAVEVFSPCGGPEIRLKDIEGPRAGTVQILHRCCDLADDGETPGNICADVEQVLKLQSAYKPTPRLKALGGLVCGLLDFAEIDGDELADVFRETTHDEQSVHSFHKGTLLVASGSDRAFDAEGIRASVGLSPYLLIPHAVLVNNGWWLARAVDEMEGVHGRRRMRRRRGIGKAEDVRADVAATLSQRLVPNVFNYRDERALYETGSKARGLQVRERVVREQLKELADKIHARHDAIRGYIGAALALILLVFTLGDAYDKHSSLYFILSTAVTVALLLALLVAFFWSEDNSRSR
jgi:ribosomal protein S18 acetylase RimI-like enzyme